MNIFGKKEENNEQKKESDLNIPPIDKILTMRQQGLTNNQIIQSLQKNGYDSNVILEAMNQSDIKQGIEEQAPQNYENPENISNQMQFQQQDDNMEQQNNLNQQMSNIAQNIDTPQNLPDFNVNSVEKISIERIEEIAEAIIDEKWNEIVRSINKIIDWKERTEEKINRIDQKFIELRKDFEGLNHGVLGKIDDYDKNIGDLGVEIKAMEKVFQKIIPSLTENVHSLEKITNKMKKQE
ncbi:MAG: hypothetical protein ACLFPJ_02095 [Candidatus Woesearchaeota archaeon]